jgi:hypothetical protein
VKSIFNFNFLTLAVIAMLVACNPPRASRNTSFSNFQNEPLGAGDGGNNNNSNNNNGGIENSGGGSNDPIPPEFNHCAMNTFPHFHAHLGNYHLCQSASDYRRFMIKIKNAIVTYKVCLAPLTSVSTGTTYIGEFMCFFANNANTVQTVNFAINRPGYQNMSLTGVFLTQDKGYYYGTPYSGTWKTPDAYFQCMDWLAYTGSSTYCTTLANAYSEYQHYVIHMVN